MFPRRLRYMPQRAYRRDIPFGGEAFTGLAVVSSKLKQSLKKYDPQFELIENKATAGVYAYRVKWYGSSPSADYLVYQFKLEHKPGWWLLQHLSKTDQWKNKSPKFAARDNMRLYDEIDKIEKQEYDLRMSEITEQTAREMIRSLSKPLVVSLK